MPVFRLRDTYEDVVASPPPKRNHAIVHSFGVNGNPVPSASSVRGLVAQLREAAKRLDFKSSSKLRGQLQVQCFLSRSN
ncbi:hypothetical protein R1flu_022208 [Riccia fluitans]|uniref:Uncharacterized protein n=1 Tax=Riccia fluitans TaxID=41844 RepID=A0ABD1ZSN3_9MARC